MPTLTPSERRTVERGVSDEVLSATVARLYKAENGARDYAYSGMLGAVMLVRSASGAFAFKLVDLNNGRVLWEHDASHNIKYQQDRPFFHSFVGSTCMIGFSFADEDEASTFFDKYARKESYVPQQPVPAPAPAPAPMAAFAPSAPPTGSMSRSSSGESIGSRPSKKESSGGGFFGRSKSKKDEKKKGKIDKSMISAPTNFEHVSHVGFNPKTGFSAQNIPMEWKVIFQKAGITDDILKDKKAAKTVAKFMKEHAGDIAKASAAPPPASEPPAPAPTPGPGRPPVPDKQQFQQQQQQQPPPIQHHQSQPSFQHHQQQSSFQHHQQQSSYQAPPPSPTRAPAPAAAAGGDGRNNLLDAIHKGVALKPAQRQEPASAPVPETNDAGDNLADALRNALQRRIQAVGDSDSDDDDDEEDEEDW